MSETEAHGRQHPTVTLSVLSLSALAYILLQSMVLPALPSIARQPRASQSSVARVLTAYLISACVAAAFVPSFARRTATARAATGGHEFDTMAVDPGLMAPSEAGLAIGEHLR
jgi:predicted MFS family arabinose efflux permease